MHYFIRRATNGAEYDDVESGHRLSV